jgi:hypothetical protein
MQRPWRIRLLGTAIVCLLLWQFFISLPGMLHPAGLVRAHPHPTPTPVTAVTVKQGNRTYKYACKVQAPQSPKESQSGRDTPRKGR